MNLLTKIKKALHKHSWVPLVSMYTGFETRDIIWECKKCGKREMHEEYRNYYSNKEFSIPTTLWITPREFQEILKGAPLANYPFLTFYQKN